jgi:hypothetical protein
MKCISTLLLVLAFATWCFSQPAGPNNSTNIYDGGSGSISETWTNPNLARTQNDTYATVVTTTTGANRRTNYLIAQNFGFNIPAGAGINGIIVQVDRYATVVGGNVTDSRVRLIDATGTIGSTDRATVFNWPTADADAYQTYGSTIDTWGITDWTSAKINNANFGVAIMAQTAASGLTYNIFVDEIRISVYYSVGGSQRYAVATGTWNSTGSWSTTPGGAPGAPVPTASDDVFIGGGFTITQDVNGADCNSLTIGTTQATPTGNLTFNANNRDVNIGAGGLVITANGDVLGTSTATLFVAGDFTLNKTLTNRDFTVRINGSSTEIISGTGSLGNLNVQTFTTQTGNLTVTVRLAGPAGRLINGSTAYLTYSGTTNDMDTDVLNLTTVGNTVEFSQTTAEATDFNFQKPSNTYYNLVISGNSPKYYNGNVTINGDLTITSTGILDNQNQNSLTLYGNWTNNNGANGFVPNSCNACVVIFQGGNGQTITNSAGEQFHRIEINKTPGTTVAAASNIVIDNRLLMTDGNLSTGANSMTGTGSVVFDGGELFIGTVGVTVPQLTGTYTLNAGTITFDGAGAQTIRSSASTPAISSFVNVQFLGSGTKSLSGAIAVSTSLVIGGTSTLDVTASNYAITLAGNWTNTATFNARSGTVTLNGSSTQTLTNASGETFNNLTINNSTASSAIILGGPVAVNGTATFTDGHMITTSSNLLTLGSSATAVAASDASHVDGPVAKVKNTTTAFVFPIGDGTNIMAASVTPTSTTSTTYVAEYFPIEQTQGTALGAGVDHISSQDYWTIQRSSGTADAAVTLVWEYASVADAEINNLGQLLVSQWTGAQWASRGNAGTTGTGTAGTITSNTITSFTTQYFVIGSSTTNNPLSNNRYFVAASGNWDGANVWAYRSGGTANASMPTITKNAIIESGNNCTISDATAGQASVTALSLTVNGTLTMANGAGRDINVTLGTGGLIMGTNGNIAGSDDDNIISGGNVVLNNSTMPTHASVEVNFSSQNHVISGTGSLPFLHINQNNQVNTGTITLTHLDVDNSITNNGSITITGELEGAGTMTNGATGTVIWQGGIGSTVSGRVINATTAGNTIQLINNTGGNIDIDLFVTGDTFHNLTLSGANSFIQSGNQDINGNLTILAGGVFNNSSGNHRLNIRGNWTNDNGAAGFVHGTNDITFDGSSAQSISISSGNEVFANLIIDNSSSTGVTISSGEVHVTSSLTLTDGIVFTTATRLLVIEDNATSDVGSASTYVDGPMKKVGNDAFVFPVGSGSTWARLGMENFTNFDTGTEFTCQYLHSAYSNTTTLDPAVNNVSTIEHWLLTKGGTDAGPVGTCRVRLYWQSESASGIEDLADLRVGHYYNPGSGLRWYNFGGTTTDNGNGTGSIVSTTTFSSFSPITFASEFGFNPLPVELLSFTGEVAHEGVMLRWSTASELNNDHFTLERSFNGIEFTPFIDVPGSGTTRVKQSYLAMDDNPFGGLSYYRLSQTDFDGFISYLDVISVRRPESAWSVFPNPSNGTTINLQVPEHRGSRPFMLKITNSQGMKVFQNEIQISIGGKHEIIFNNALASGVYTVEIIDGINRETKRIVVK